MTENHKPKVALYISHPNMTPELQQELQHIFDTYKVFPEVDTLIDYIALVPNSTWAHGLGPLDIWTHHHKAENVPGRYCHKPIVILDTQTVRDRTVVIVADFMNARENMEVSVLRIAPPMVNIVACNLEIVNQTIDEFVEMADTDGVFRGFPNSKFRVEWPPKA